MFRHNNTPEHTDSINRAPHVTGLEARDFDWLLEQYLADRSRLVDKATAKSYRCRLQIVIEWWHAVGPANNWLLRASDLEALEIYLRGRKSPQSGKVLSYTYRRGILQSLREAFRWSYSKGYIKHDYGLWVPVADGMKTKRKAASELQLIRLLRECENSTLATRDKAIIAIFIGMGLRCAEVANLRVEDIHFVDGQSGYANVKGKRTKANKDGKRNAAFDVATGRLVADHIGRRRFGPLFFSYRDKPLRPSSVYDIVKRLIKRAGLEDEIQACHDLRRAFVTYYARKKKGNDSADMRRRQLGHASYRQTADYTLYEVEDIRQDIVSVVSLL